MKLNSIRRLSVLALTVGISMGAVACTSNVDNNDSKSVELSQKTPEKALESAVHTIADISSKYADMSEDEMISSGEKLSSYFDTAVDDEARADVIAVFAQVLEIDPEATINVDSEKIEVDGDTARLNGKDIEVTMFGEVQNATESGGVITLKLQDKKWVISDIEIPNVESSITDDEITDVEEDSNE